MTRRTKVLFAVAAACVLAVAGYASIKRKPAVATLAPQAIVEFTQQDLYIVEPQALERTLPLTGTLSPFTEATLKAKVPGELVEVAVREGESVKQGQVLARIDPTEVQARVAARQADVAAARAQLALWIVDDRVDVDRARAGHRRRVDALDAPAEGALAEAVDAERYLLAHAQPADLYRRHGGLELQARQVDHGDHLGVQGDALAGLRVALRDDAGERRHQLRVAE